MENSLQHFPLSKADINGCVGGLAVMLDWEQGGTYVVEHFVGNETLIFFFLVIWW